MLHQFVSVGFCCIKTSLSFILRDKEQVCMPTCCESPAASRFQQRSHALGLLAVWNRRVWFRVSHPAPLVCSAFQGLAVSLTSAQRHLPHPRLSGACQGIGPQLSVEQNCGQTTVSAEIPVQVRTMGFVRFPSDPLVSLAGQEKAL